MMDQLGDSNVVVVYRNAVELDEDDIIVLDAGSISDATKVN